MPEQAALAADDLVALRAHTSMFGYDTIIKPLGRKWTVEFRGSGYPSTFSTKTAAREWARLWVRTAAA